MTSTRRASRAWCGRGGDSGRASEILRGEVKLEELAYGYDTISSRGSVATVSSSSGNGLASEKQTRLTKSVIIVALGCLFYSQSSTSYPFVKLEHDRWLVGVL